MDYEQHDEDIEAPISIDENEVLLQQQQQQQQKKDEILTLDNDSENENSLVKYLINNRDECQQLIGEVIKIEQLDLNTIKDYLNHIDFNEFLKRCTKNRIFKTQTITAKASNRQSSIELTSKHSKKIVKRVVDSGSDYEFIANTECSSESAAAAALNINNNLLNQKKSLRLKKKNLLFKKLIEREKDDYYDYSIDEEDSAADEFEQQRVGKKPAKTQSPPNLSHQHKTPKQQQCDAKGMVNVIVNGKNVFIDEKDYKQFVRCGKWCSLEFFRIETNEEKQDCLFCKRKCKSTIDNVYICVLCRNFAYKTLSKHLAYVCKERFITPELCKMPKKINDFSRDKYCRFCYFYNIFNALERLTRLQKYLVEFKNKTLIFLNSGPKKIKPSNENESDLDDQENRDINNSSFSNNNNNNKRNKSLEIGNNEDDSQMSFDDDNDEDDQSTIDMNDECDGLLNFENDYYDFYNNYFESSISTNNQQRTGPRVKHVSRREPIPLKVLTTDDNEYISVIPSPTTALYNSTNNYINHLNLQSINNFHLRLSALPDKEKRAFIRQFRFSRINRLNAEKSNHTLNLSNMMDTSSTTATTFINNTHIVGSSNDFDDEITSLHNKNQSSLKIFRKQQSSTTTTTSEQPHHLESTKKKSLSSKIDDFIYEEQKKKKLKRTISSQISSQSNVENSNEQTSINNIEHQPIQHYVFTGWEDYFERYHKISTNQSFLRIKNVTNTNSGDNGDFVGGNENDSTSSTVNYGKSERLKFKGITQKLFKETEPHAMNLVHTHSPSNLTNLNSNVNNQLNNINSNLNYGTTNSLVWDMQPDYDIFEIWKHGYPILSQKPICIKSACYLCGSLDVDTDQLLYCNVCCEPFHAYCIEDYERPKETTHKLNWICPTCKFCEICGLQNELLHCARCENCYHSTCFKKTNYPKKPTKKSHLWVCYDCFKCKSCGSTNMNFDQKMYFKMPNYDYNFCFDCDKHMSTGDYCRICKIGYNREILDASDESALKYKMIKCSTCNYWSHSKCVDLSDENFDILFDISPHIIKFNCKICKPDANYDQKLIEFKNETLLHVINELKSNAKLVIDETVEFEESFIPIEQKLSSKSYIYIKSFMNDFDCLENDEKFENNLFGLLKTSLLELMKEKFKNINPDNLIIPSQPTVIPSTTTTTSINNDIKNEKKKIKRLLKKAHKDEATAVGDKLTEVEGGGLDIDKIKDLTNQIIVKIPYEDHTYALSASSLNLLESVSATPRASLSTDHHQENIGVEKRAKKKSKTLASSKLDTSYSLINVKDWDNVQSSLDTRKCYLCQLNGDHNKCGRLISFDLNWIHLNCLLWSQDITTNDHIIEQIQLLTTKLKNSNCKYCNKDGATIQCKYKNCESVYHFNCSVLNECILTEDRLLFCRCHYEEYEIFSFNLFKNYDHNHQCFIVNVDGYRKKYSYPVFNINSIYVLIGSMQVINLGEIDSVSDSDDVLYPIDYCCSRVYWSAFEIGKKVLYKCKIRRVNSTSKRENEITICHDPQKLNELMLQTDGNSDFLIENDDNSMNTDKSTLTITADAAVAATSTVTITNIDPTPSSLSSNNRFINIKHNDFSNYFNTNYKNQTLSKIFSKPETIIDARSPSSSTSSSSTTSSASNIKPKVLKLPNDYNKSNIMPTSSLGGNIQTTTGGRIDKSGIRNHENQTPSISFLMSSNNFGYFNKHQQHQLNVDIPIIIRNTNLLESYSIEDNASPKSDKSDSSLKLDYSSIMSYPLSSCYGGSTGDGATGVILGGGGGGEGDVHYQLQLQIQHQIQQQLLLQQQQLQLQHMNIISQSPTENDQIMKKKSSKKSNKTKQLSLNNGGSEYEMNYDYNEYHAEKQQSNKNKANLINPRTVITKCSKTRSQHTIKQLLDNFDNMNKKLESVEKFNNQSTTSSPTKSITPTSSLALLLNSERPFQRHIHDIVDQSNNSESSSFSPSTTSTSSSINLKLNSKPARPTKRKCNEILSENENMAMSTSVIEAEKRVILGELSDNVKIEENDLNDCDLIFEITSEDGLFVQSKDINDAWKKVTERVNKLREMNNFKLLSHQGINGLTMYGLNNKAISYLLEQFDSVQYCNLYKSKYVPKRTSEDNSWKINVDGCVRVSQPFDKNTKRCTDYFHWLTSNQRNDYYFMNRNFDDTFWLARKALLSPEISSSMKYRHLKNFSKRSLVVKRSPIHGRGLFTLADLQQGQMIIEYSGEIIRNQLCDKREKYYETKGIGCYMFRIDEQDVIDATRKGNQARFINHSCEPNCISKVLIIQGHKHIVIFAQKFINKSEELTYDYKFPKEEIKIQCLCKSVKCRKYLN